MAVGKVLLQEYVQAVRALARRAYVAKQLAGSVTDLVKFNRQLEIDINCSFFAPNAIRKITEDDSRHYVPSPNRNAFNEQVPLAWAEDAARVVLGNKAELPKLKPNNDVDHILLDAVQIKHLQPNADLQLFETIANICSVVRSIEETTKSKNDGNYTCDQARAIKLEFSKLKFWGPELLNILKHTVLTQLTNTNKEQRELKNILKKIASQPDIQSKAAGEQFVKDINAIYDLTGKVFVLDLLKTSRQSKPLPQGSLFDVA